VVSSAVASEDGPAAEKTRGGRDLFPARPLFQRPQQRRPTLRSKKDKRLQILVIQILVMRF